MKETPQTRIIIGQVVAMGLSLAVAGWLRSEFKFGKEWSFAAAVVALIWPSVAMLLWGIWGTQIELRVAPAVAGRSPNRGRSAARRIVWTGTILALGLAILMAVGYGASRFVVWTSRASERSHNSASGSVTTTP